MIELKSISKTFNPGTVNENKAINNLSLKLNDGEFITVIGGNGAGKSTLLNIIAGSILADEGLILINGKDISNMREYKRAPYFGRVFQDPMKGTATDMTILENLALAKGRGKMRSLFKWSISKGDKEEFIELLKTLDLGLENRIHQKVGLLSGGQRQALTLLMATMEKAGQKEGENPILLLDEHTAALDPKTASKVLDITNKIIREKHLTTIMITHNMSDAIKYGDRLIMMSKGEIVVDISGEEKKNLTIEELLKLFSIKSDNDVISDAAVLGD